MNTGFCEQRGPTYFTLLSEKIKNENKVDGILAFMLKNKQKKTHIYLRFIIKPYVPLKFENHASIVQK